MMKSLLNTLCRGQSIIRWESPVSNWIDRAQEEERLRNRGFVGICIQIVIGTIKPRDDLPKLVKYKERTEEPEKKRKLHRKECWG